MRRSGAIRFPVSTPCRFRAQPYFLNMGGSQVRFLRVQLLFFAVLSSCAISAFGQGPAEQVCRRPVAGATVPEPRDLRSREGVLRVELTYRSSRDAQGNTRFYFQARCGYGPRLPFLVVSPYAKKNFVDHTLTDQSSVVRFIEDNWKLPQIGNGSFDEIAGPLLNMFDFKNKRSEKIILSPSTGQVVFVK